jgi:hypothetical protein
MTELNWHPDYGPYALWQSLAEAMDALKYEPQRVVVIYAGDTLTGPVDVLGTYSMRSTPSQGIAVALGMAAANPALKVVVFTRSSHLQIEGQQALIQAARENHNITIVSLQEGSPMDSVPLLTALLACAANLLARAYVGDPQQLQQLCKTALRTDGFSLVEVLAPRGDDPTLTPASVRSRLFPLQIGNKQADWPADDAAKTASRLLDAHGRIDVGILFRAKKQSAQAKLLQRIGAPLVDQTLKPLNPKQLLARLAMLDDTTGS